LANTGQPFFAHLLILFIGAAVTVRDGIFNLLRSTGIDSISLCRLAGRYDNPIPTRFIASIDSTKIPAQARYKPIVTHRRPNKNCVQN
jgi:hypothetical protein